MLRAGARQGVFDGTRIGLHLEGQGLCHFTSFPLLQPLASYFNGRWTSPLQGCLRLSGLSPKRVLAPDDIITIFLIEMSLSTQSLQMETQKQVSSRPTAMHALIKLRVS